MSKLVIINPPTRFEIRCTGITESTSFVKTDTHVFWSMMTAYENPQFRIEPKKNVYVIKNIEKDDGEEDQDKTEA